MASEIILVNTTLFIDYRRPFIKEETFSVLMLINPAIITFVISIVGIGTNIATIITFVKLGFKDTINISLITLAVTDLVSLLFLILMCLSYNPAFCGPVCDIIDLRQLEDFILCDPRSYFNTVGGCITGLIALERCLCVLRPLQVKMLINKRRLQIILPIMFITCLLPYLPLVYTTGVSWVFYPLKNRSVLTRTHKDHLYQVDIVSYTLVMALNMVTYALVIIFTVLIVWKLASQSNWRSDQEGSQVSAKKDTNSDEKENNKKKGLSGRDRRATMTVTVIAAMYITCFFPGRVLYLTMALVEDFNKGYLYTNLYDFLWYIAYVGEAICASGNIIVYLKSSAKFKEAFLGMLGRGPANEKQKK